MRRLLMICAFLAGCGTVPVSEPVDVKTGSITATVQRPVPRPGGAAVPSKPSAPEVSVGTLGRTVASLGNAAEPGLWLKTPLVTSERAARVFNPATEQSAEVTLIPIEGPATAGSRMSLAAMQAIGAPLGDLVEVDVFGF